MKLWNDRYRPELADGLPSTAAVDQEVDRLARQRWPGGVLVQTRDPEAALARTAELLADPAVEIIYEGAVASRGVWVRPDILSRAPDGLWDLVEVRAASRIKALHEIDVALQYRILLDAGLKLRRAGLLVLDRNYRYTGGPLDLTALFRLVDLTDRCLANREQIDQRLTELQAMLDQPQPPDIAVGDHCRKPYMCSYYSHCTRHLDSPRYPLRQLPDMNDLRYTALTNLGITSIEDIPADYPLTTRQRRVRDSIASDRPWISPQLGAALEAVQWPLFYLDFEAAGCAIPRFTGMRPFDPLPFQFSCHIQARPGATLEHVEFLADDCSDPRRPLAEALLAALGQSGTVIVYSGYEARTIRMLAYWLPELSPALLALLERLQDLLEIVRKHYYHPLFGGSLSIKKVLPAVVDGAGYGDMPIADGYTAGAAWQRMLASGDAVERESIEQALRSYCRRDSWAMAALRDALLVEAHTPIADSHASSD